MKIFPILLLSTSLMAQIPSTTTDAKIVALQKKINATGATADPKVQHQMLRDLWELKSLSAREHTAEKNKAADDNLKAASQAAAAKARAAQPK
jgi:hypothetical protein